MLLYFDMVKRLLTFALSAGFFIWLPNAFADGGGLSLDAPSHIRQTQGEGNALLTLRVDNIQVRAEWRVTDADKVFTIKAGSNVGVLHTVTTIVAPVTHVATIYVEDTFDLLNDSYANLTASAVITVKFESGGLELADAPRLTAVAGKAVSLHTFVAEGGSGDKTYTLVAGGDGHFDLDKDSGVLSLQASAQAGVYTLTVQAAEEGLEPVEALVTVEVLAALSLADAPPFTVIASVAMSLHTFIASGGIGVKTYTLLAGEEEYFSVDAGSGVLSLSMNAELGRHTLTVQVMDARDNTAQATVMVEVSAALKLAKVSSFTVIASMAMSLRTFIVSGGIGTPTYEIVSGNEKEGFTLNAASGVLSLVADAEPDTYVLRIQAMDAHNNAAETVVTVGVSAVLSLADAPSFTVIASVAMSLHTFIASGGIGTPTYTILAGNKGRDFTLNAASGVLSLQADAALGSHTLTVQVMDGWDNTAQAVATVGVSAALKLAAAPSFTVIASVAMSLHRFIASGGIGLRTYTLLAGDERYFSVGAGSGVLSLQADAALGSHTLTVQVMDGRDNTAQAVAMVEVSMALELAEVSSFTVIASMAMSLHTFVASGGIGTPTYEIVSGNEKEGFTLNAASGVLSLVANAEPDTYVLRIQAMDARHNTAEVLVTVGVSAVLSLADAPSFTVIASVAMSLHTFIASGGVGLRTYTLLAGEENYFSVGAGSGVLSLSMNAEVGSHTLTVQVMDGWNNTVQAVATVEVSAALTLSAVPSFTLIASVGMNLHTLFASGGIGTPTYAILDGNKDGHFALDATSGVLSLSANAKPDNYVLRIQAKDARDNTAQAMVTVGVSAVLSLADAPRLGGARGIEVSLHTFAAQGGIGARTYTLLTDDVEDYFNLDAESGALSLLTVAPVSVYILSVQVKDDRGHEAQALATVRVALLYLADAMPLFAVVGREVSLHTFDAQGADGTLTYTITAGDDKNYFNLDVASGVLSVRAIAAIGVYTLSVRAEDAAGNQADAMALVEVRASLSLVAVPPLTVIVGRVAHTLMASGGIGKHTYAIESGDDDGHFALDAARGVLSLRADAALGRHTLTLQVADARANTVQAVATVEVSAVLELAAAPSFTVIASVAMSLHTFIASGGIGTPTYTIAGNEVEHFDLDAASGVLSLSMNAEVGSHILTVQVMDGRDNTADTVVTVGVSAVLSLAAAPSFTVIASVAMSLHTFIAGGGIGSRAYTLLAGDERYFSVGADNGVLSLSMNAEVGSHTLTVQVMDGRDNIAEAVATVEVSAALELAAAPSFTVIASVAMSLHTFIASGGIGTPTYTIVAGNDDGYFALNATSGVLSLTVDAAVGSHTLTVQVMDERGNTAQALATVGVSAVLVLTAAPSFTVIASVAMSLHTFIAGGGIGSRTYTLLAGDERYFSVDAASGVLSLSVDAAVGSHTLTVQVMDERDNTAETVATVEVSAVLALAAAPSFTVIASVAMSLHTFIASGGIGTPTYTIFAGNDDGYFALNATSGVLSLTVDAAVGSHTLTVQVMDARDNTAQAVATVEVSAVLALADAPSFTVIASVAMSLHTFIASGGIGTPTYTIFAGNDDGNFALNAASGVLSLTADAAVGSHTLTVQVMDERGNTAQAVATVGVSAALALADAPSFTVIASVAMSLHTFIASGGVGIKTYTLVAGDAEEYFAVDAASGVFSLSLSTPVREYTLTVQAMDERANTVETVVTVGVSAVLALADAPLLRTVVREAGNLHTFAATGGIGDKTYTIAAGNEDYFSLDPSSGVLSMNADVSLGMYTLSVQAADTEGNAVPALATVEVASLLLRDVMLYAVVGREVSLHTFEADGGEGAKTYTIVAGNEAKYFTLDADSGVLSVQGNVSVGIYTLSMQVEDAGGNQAEALAVVSVAVEDSLLLADAPSLVAFTEMTMSLYTFAASGGIGAKTYTIVAAGDGADYFTLNATSGVLSVANAAAGVYTLSVKVSDSKGNSAQARGTVQVVGVLSLADAPSLEALARLSLTVALHTFAASGGYGAKRYTLIADEKSYFALDADSGELSLPSNSAMLAGVYTLRVEVSDSLSSPQRATAAATVQIARNRIFVLGGNENPTATNDLQNDVWRSADGESWSLVTGSADWTARELHQVVAHRGRMYLMGGLEPGVRNDVWSSLDGKNWSLVTGSAGWSARGGHQGLVHNGRMYVLGGRDANGHRNDVWSSADGVTWRKDKANNSVGWVLALYQAVAHNGRMYVLGGYNKSDVWSSADGSSWRFEGNAAWGLRHLHQAVSHAGRLYVLGGIERVNNSDNRRNDVWSSLDGRIWEQEKANNNAFWARRDRYQALSRDGLLYVLGGNAGSLRKDVWSSPDGKSWDEETSAAGWGAREYHQALVFPPHLALSGTSETITLTLQAELEIYPFSAQYGGGQYAYSLTPEIEGFRIDGAGVLSADGDAQAGAYEITVRVEDEEGSHAESIINIELQGLALADAPPLFAVAGLSVAVSLHAFTAIYGIGVPVYNLVDDSGYFTLDAVNGVLSVTANVAAGVYTVSVEVSDDSGKMATAVATVEALLMLSLADAPLLSVVAGKALELHTFTAVGGIKAKTYNLVGTPAGYFTLGASSGILSVQAASEVGIYTVSVEVSDSAGNQATAQATVGVTARLSLVGASLMAVEKKAVSLHTFVASGGIGARTYTLSVGNETGYFVLDAASGVLSLSASASAGEYTLTVGVKDERANIATAVATVNISAGLSLAGVSQLLVVAEGEAKNLHTFVASGGLGVKTYTLAAGAGYFTIGAASGVLSVDANATVGIYTLSVQAADADGNVVQALATAQVVPLLLADVMLYAIVGREVSLHTFEADGEGVAKTYTIVAGDEDKYFRLDANSGVLSVQGSATVGVYTLSVEVTDAEDNRAEALAVVAVEASLFLADAPPLTVMAGLAVSLHTFAASGGIGVKAYTITAGNEAGYFTLNAASGVLSLRATAPEGFHTLTVQAVDEYDNLAEAVATVDVSAALSLADASLLVAVAGMTMSVHTFAASGGIGAKTYTLSADNGAGYFAINATSGALSVVNATVGVYTLSVKVSDSRGNSVQARATVQVLPPMSLADAPPLAALARLSVTVALHTFVASDGIGSKRYTIIADQSGYFALDAVSGELLLPSNSAMRAGAYTLRVEVSDSLSSPQRATAAATVQIARNGIFVLGGAISAGPGGGTAYKNDVWWWSAAGGKAWKRETANASWDARDNHQAVAYHGRLYVMGGWATGNYANDVWWSADGKAWKRETANVGWTARSNHQAVAYQGRLYVLGGSGTGQDVWSWADGEESWRQDATEAWPSREEHQAVVHNGRLYVLGGYRRSIDQGRNDVWSWADGENNWSFEGNAPWARRLRFQAVSHMGRLYVMGGAVSSGIGNDVWSSLDGKSWRLETAAAAWGSIEGHQVVSRDGRLYLMGDRNYYSNEVWSSVDGKSWERENPANANWQARRVFQAVVFPPSLVLSGTSKKIILTAGVAAELHPLSAQYGVGQYTYSLAMEVTGFDIDESSGALSAYDNAAVGGYTLTVRVEDEEGSHAETIINIEIRSIALADAPPLSVIVGAEAVSLHVFTAIYGVGKSTYNLVDDSGYFTLGDESGVLSLTANVAEGVYTLSVLVSDENNNQATAVATVVARVLSLADAPLLEALAGLSVTVALHTFAAGGIGSKRYTIIAGNEAGYFALDADSGELSLPSNSAMRPGAYTLRVEVEVPGSLSPQRATAAATVQIARNGIFVLGGRVGGNGYNNDVWWWSAAGGNAWKRETAKANWPARFDHQAAAYHGRLYVMGGWTGTAGNYANDVWSSADGKAWKRETANVGWTPRLNHQAVAYQGRLYVLGGNSGGQEVWSWADGEESWRQDATEAWPEIDNLQAVVHNGRLYVLGGGEYPTYYNDVWSSADGANWRFEGNAGWPGRIRHQAVSHQGRLYILGGADGDVKYNDVWSSLDGKSWRQETAAAPWGALEGHQVVSRDGRLYLMGGNNYSNEVWSSVDGKSWGRENPANANWQARRSFQAVVFPPSLVLSGTSETITLAAGVAAEFHMLSAQYGVGQYTYSLVSEVTGFDIDKSSGALSADGNAAVDGYMLTVQVEDGEGNHAETIINIELRVLALADAPPLSVIAGTEAVSLHVFTAIYGVGKSTYNLVDDSGYFTLGTESGVLSLTANVSEGVYTLSVVVRDESDNQNQATAVATVEAVPLSLADAPLSEVLAGLSVTVVLHTFVASDGIGSKRYTIIAGNEAGYFALDADSGELSLPSNRAMRAGAYTLRVEVEVPGSLSPQRVTAAATVHITKNRIFVTGGRASVSDYNNEVWWWSAVGGDEWKRETATVDWPARFSHQAVAYHGRLYVMGGWVGGSGGYANDVWSSADGKVWKRETAKVGWAARYGHQAVAYQGRLYVLGGNSGEREVWSWADGEEKWRKDAAEVWSEREGHRAVVHNGRLYVLGGGEYPTYYKDVWSSADGANWTLEGNAAWEGRDKFQAVSHQGRLYILGGEGADEPYDDVWSSLDGKIWRQETEEAPWGKIDSHQVVSRDGMLYLMGGAYRRNYRNAVWSSADGKSWERADPANADWKVRRNFQAVVFPPSLVLSGTSETITLTMQAAAVALHTLSAKYGVGQYTYSLPLESEALGFGIDKSSGVLSADENAAVGGYTLTVQVEDEEGSQVETVVQVEIVAASTAASSIISPPASGGGASALALAGGGLSLLIITPPASSLARPRTPPTSAGGENLSQILL